MSTKNVYAKKKLIFFTLC